MKRYVFGRRVRGASHVRAGMVCQDSLRRILLEDGSVILSVADGHGSSTSPYSRAGSEIAVNVFCGMMRSLCGRYAEERERLFMYLCREGDTLFAHAVETEWKKRVAEYHAGKGRGIPLAPDGEPDTAALNRLYGTTLLGLLVTDTFTFALQVGDGDICFADGNGVSYVVEPEKLLGVETYSLSRDNAWEKAVTSVRRTDGGALKPPAMFMLTTDGFANSYGTDDAFKDAVADYLDILVSHGPKAVDEHLTEWLCETSEMGSGDDIAMLIAYYAPDERRAPVEGERPDGHDAAEALPPEGSDHAQRDKG